MVDQIDLNEEQLLLKFWEKNRKLFIIMMDVCKDDPSISEEDRKNIESYYNELVKLERRRTQKPKMDKLFEWDIVRPGYKMFIKGVEDSEATVIDDKTVDFKGEIMSYRQWGLKVKESLSSINYFEYAILEGQTKILAEIREEKMIELNYTG